MPSPPTSAENFGTPARDRRDRWTRRQALRAAGGSLLTGLLWPAVGCRSGPGGVVAAVPGAPGTQGNRPAAAEKLAGLSGPGGFGEVGMLPAREPVPDLSDGQIVRRVAGIRPYRRGSHRLELEQMGRQTVVHNYGHGGAGVSLSWGTAEVAADLLESSIVSTKSRREAAVLGGGVVGLSTAVVLLERGWRVTVYAEKFATQTTSNWAGAQFAPAGIETRDPVQLADLTRRSALRYMALARRGVGVERRINYVTGTGGSALSELPSDLLGWCSLDRLPFPGVSVRGRAYETMLIEPPRYLPWLLGEMHRGGGQTVTRRFASVDELSSLSQPAVVNCLGLGAREVFGDQQMVAVRGQLLHLKPQALPYMLSHRGYMFPRSDVLVLGGSYERGQEQAVTSDRVCNTIMQRHREFFAPPTRVAPAA